MVFPTPLLDQAKARRRQADEHSRLKMQQTVARWLRENAAQYGIQRAYLFGSIIQPGRFTQGSDVDLAVETIQSEQFFEAIAALSEAVEREVDLVDLTQCPFAAQIRRRGVLWINKTGYC